MVFLSLAEAVPLTAAQVAARLKEAGILVSLAAERRFRLVTYHGISDADVARVAPAFAQALAD
jgi:acetylornithine/succinyldiaminopimelate/putrescine aminotransferase